MKKVVKRMAIVAALLVGGLLAAGLIGRGMLKGTPDYYRTYTWDGAQRSIVSQRAADKLLKTRQIAQQAHFGEIRAQRAGQGGGQTERPGSVSSSTTRPATPAGVTVTFTEEELNAFLFHNSETFKEWKQKYQQYVSDPGIFLQNGCLILAAKAKDFGTVVSLHLAPKLDEQGQLELRHAGSYGGKLPLPEVLLRPSLDRMKASMTARMPAWIAAAKLDRNGGFNSSAAAAGMGQLLINSLDNKPSEPVIFMPVDEGETSVPLKITKVSVEGRALSLTVQAMDRAEREAVFERLKPKSIAGK